MADRTGDSGARFSLGTRLFLAIALLVTLAVAASVAITYFLGNQVATQEVRNTLEHSSRVQSVFNDARIGRVGLTSEVVAFDAPFVAYVAEAIEAGDVASLRDQLEERSGDFTFALILTAEGEVVAPAGDVPSSEQDLSADPLYLKALDEYSAAGMWERNDRLFNAAVVPIEAGGLLAGFLMAAEEIDDTRANELRDVNATEVTFITTPQGKKPALIATTLDGEMAEALMNELDSRPGLLGPSLEADPDGGHLQVELEGRRWLALVRPLRDVADKPIGVAVNLASFDEQIAPFQRIISILAAVGLVTILVALLISYLLPRRVLQPISELAGAAKAAAEGDYDQEIHASGGDEVGQLGNAFSTLLSELREKRDMEIYVSELNRNLPDHDSNTIEAAPAEARQVALLGVELRDYSRGMSGEPQDALETLTLDLRRISRLIRSHNGQVESVLGHRLVASFDGSRRSLLALSSAADILAHEASAGHKHSLAVALVTGAAVSGSVTWDNKLEYAVTGWPVEHLEGLLRVARAGSVLLSKTTHDELSQALTQNGVQAQEHRSTISTEPLYSLPNDAVRRFSGPEGSATLEMTTEIEAMPTATAAPTLSGFGPGSVLDNRFEILSELGAGGMGVVYKARDRTLGELVALKMLKQDVFAGSERLERLKDELRLARKISHPNVLSTFDFGEADGFPFISMEYVRGITLKHLLDQSGRLPLSAGLRLARQLCRGLWAAHSKAVLHRDIKPENLIIEHNGNAKLMDFGIARPIQRAGPSQTQPGTLVGTPFYLAPEQLEGTEPDERADIYACGVVFYEIFTGTLPYPSSGNLMDVIRRKMNEEPAPPSEHWPTMPHTLEAIIMRCLERDRNKRFANAETLLKELEILRA